MSTYQEIMDDARVPLRDASKNRLDDTKMLRLLVRVVQIALKHVAKQMPEMLWTTSSINLTTTTGYGPYNLPTAVGTIVDIYDDQTQPKPLTKTSRDKALYTQAVGRPTEYWIEGHTPSKCYFGSIPDQNRTYTLYYIPIVARVTDAATELPLPDLFFDLLVELLAKFAGSVDEYLTTDEDTFSTLIMQGVDGVLLELKAPRTLELEDYGF